MSKVFEIEIMEKRSRIVEVEADTLEEALSKTENKYADRRIELDDDSVKFWSIEQYRG